MRPRCAPRARLVRSRSIRPRPLRSPRERGMTAIPTDTLVTALGADETAPSLYARSKATGEKLVLAAMPSATILRPSVVFGPEDDFFNKFAAMARIAPALPLVGGGETLFQPVFAGDVAAAVLAAVEGRATGGQIYELGGPDVKSFKELMQFVLAAIERRRLS